MAINVYWASTENEWMRAKEPEPVSKLFYNKKIADTNNPNINLNYCPGFNQNLKNLYAVRSIYDYSITIQDSIPFSKFYDQKFYDDHVLIRSIDKKIISFRNGLIFFSDSDSLEMTAYEYPLFEQNEITKRCIPISGMFDIGKWFRPLEFPFLLKENFDTFVVNYDDILYYLRFHTKEKIIFKQFFMTERLSHMKDSSINITLNKTKFFKGFDNIYNKMKLKPLILKEIKANLL